MIYLLDTTCCPFTLQAGDHFRQDFRADEPLCKVKNTIKEVKWYMTGKIVVWFPAITSQFLLSNKIHFQIG